MIPLSVAIVCLTLLLVQQSHQKHQQDMRVGLSSVDVLLARMASLEQAKATQYSHAAFEDLKTKVESLRLAQGLKR